MESVWSSIFGVSQVSTSLSAFWLGFFPTVWVPNPISIHIIWYLFSEISTMISPFSPVTSQCFNCFNPHFNCLVVHQTKRQTISPSSTIWVWVNTYYIIHINTIFSGMNIHESQLFLCFTRGTRFWHTAISIYINPWVLWKSTWPPQWPRLGASRIRGSGLFHDGPSETKLATSRPVMPREVTNGTTTTNMVLWQESPKLLYNLW